MATLRRALGWVTRKRPHATTTALVLEVDELAPVTATPEVAALQLAIVELIVARTIAYRTDAVAAARLDLQLFRQLFGRSKGGAS
jgi:hypothetical protein